MPWKYNVPCPEGTEREWNRFIPPWRKEYVTVITDHGETSGYGWGFVMDVFKFHNGKWKKYKTYINRTTPICY